MSNELKMHTTQDSGAMPFRLSLYQQHGHHQASLGITRELGRILGPTPGLGHPQEEGVSSPGDSDTCFEAVTGRTGEVCVENTPARTLPRESRGLEEGTETWRRGQRLLHFKEASLRSFPEILGQLSG